MKSGRGFSPLALQVFFVGMAMSSYAVKAEPIPMVSGETLEFSIAPEETVELFHSVDTAFAQVTVTIGLGETLASCDGPALTLRILGEVTNGSQSFVTSLVPGVYSATLPSDTYSLTIGWDQSALDTAVNSGCSIPETLDFQILLTVRPIVDRLEPDNSPDEARWLGANGEGQVHRLSNEDDEDWMSFVDPGNSTIVIRARSLFSTLDPALELYAADGLTILDSVTGNGSDTIEMEYDNPLDQNAQFYIRLFSTDETKGGGGVFVVEAQSSGGGLLAALAGTVTDAAGGTPLNGADVVLETLGGASAVTNSSGVYTFNGLPQGLQTVTASASGFSPESAGINLGAGINQADFFLAEGGGGGCFIATAAFGTPLAPEIDALRRFRDRQLLTNVLGTAFTDFYYTISPPIADAVAASPALAALVRGGLTVVIGGARAFDAHPWAIAGCAAGIALACLVRAARRQIRRGP